MAFNDSAVTRSSSSVLETNKVLKNTYSLLSITLIFSGIMAAISMAINVPYGASMISSLVALGLVWFVLPRTANSSMGIVVVFAFTGLLGFGLGPILNHYLAFENGARIISLSLAGTGIIFLGLSGYALTTKKDFSFLGGFLFAGMLMVIIAVIANIFLGFQGLALAISSIVILIMSGFILYDTSRIINGGEKNYIMATVGLYLSIYNIFVSLLHLLGALGGDD
ncbi:Putative TEGT family carrier/transport protein [hydrothermal vent metagenome]|uniref:TEGT family carrier/transport protein n=1 Tax=hydrothermal vent metagenome TaxID=652676 RepID=A0A3B1APG5_9ZZZZ